MSGLRLALPTFVTLVALLTALVVTPVAHAQTSPSQEGQAPRPTSTLAGSVSLGGTGTPWGTRMEHWLAAGIGLALGAATVATGTGLSRYSIDLNHHALALETTQADAASSANTARDFMLAAETLWIVGASFAAIALTWIVVLSFSTPAPSGTPEAATAPSASLRLSPLGVTLEGVF